MKMDTQRNFKQGDVVMIYGNPVKQENPIGKAKLISKLAARSAKLEYWQIEYIDSPAHKYEAFINTAEDGQSK